jgi:hypothetical protein
MRVRRTAVVALVIAAAGVVAGCGDGDTEQIEDVVVEVHRDPGAELCRNATLAFKEELTGERGAAAERSCPQFARQTAPIADLEVSDVKVDGDRATAKVESSLANFEVKLVKEDGAWRIAPGGAGGPLGTTTIQ